MDLSQMGDVSKGEPLDVMSCKFTLGMKFFMYFLVTFIVFFIVFGFLPTDMLNKLSSLLLGIPKFLLKLVPGFIRKIFSSIWTAIKFVWNGIITGIKMIIDILVPKFIQKFVTQTVPNFIWKLIPRFIKNIYYKIRNLFTIYLPQFLNVVVLALIYYMIYYIFFNIFPLIFTFIMGSAMGNILTMTAKKMSKKK